jgi:hypothetical protein
MNYQNMNVPGYNQMMQPGINTGNQQPQSEGFRNVFGLLGKK